MVSILRGKIRGGAIELSEPVTLPDGTEVMVSIEPLVAGKRDDLSTADSADALPFIGIWADRDDMSDSAAWVRKEREAWQQRLAQRD